MSVKIVVASLMACGVAGPIAALASAPPPAPDGLVFVMAANPAALVEDSGGRVIGPGVARFGAFASGDAAFVAQLLSSKAWLVKDGQYIAQICG